MFGKVMNQRILFLNALGSSLGDILRVCESQKIALHVVYNFEEFLREGNFGTFNVAWWFLRKDVYNGHRSKENHKV